MGETPGMRDVMVTGATGFVGRAVVRELLKKGLRPVCLVRSPGKLFGQHSDVSADRLTAVVGSLFQRAKLREAAEQSQAAIHLVGIIIERRLQGQTFARIHAQGTQRVVDALQEADVKRLVHMSALGTRPQAVSKYHRTKWAAEECVRRSGLDWTILRPSIIHGPHGEFMRLMYRFFCGFVPPIIPLFGSGRARVQPVFVKDVAHCAVAALSRDPLIGAVLPLGGPQAYSWREFYATCQALMPGAKKFKPVVSQPVAVAKLMAVLSAAPMAIGELVVPAMRLFRFDRGQVDMSQEDSVCDHTLAEQAFGMRMRRFDEELTAYADQLR